MVKIKNILNIYFVYNHAVYRVILNHNKPINIFRLNSVVDIQAHNCCTLQHYASILRSIHILSGYLIG